ncbi:hypothetical protein E3T54_02005 [Cryobacterium sp. Sr8]|uniref:hypothetical protein n=1 Tax=Cryobacterium sp. Sr8 TaxID=1259203 RepID=UPI00106A56F6|nr:hypothetical protein [Cryobacterium sp. Sr8]TFD81358.1 hypothetical protein E3T54_02005 [Cryobacterium sp. Sr8]
MTNLPPATPTRTLPIAETEVLSYAEGRRSDDPPATTAEPAPYRPAPAPSAARPAVPQRTTLVILAAMGALAIAFIVLMVVGVTNESINALAVFATPIASMVAAYYGVTLSIQQVKNERAEKERALERADAAVTASRETEVWAAQMESGLRVAMAKLNAARVNTDEVTKAAGTPDDFF